jgi:RNase P/RNase MRP subunit POP5
MVRFKNRYILLEISFLNNEIISGLSKYTILSSITDETAEIFGLASSQFGLISIKYYSCYTNLAIVRVERDSYKQVWACLTMITKIKNRQCKLRVLQISGTIKMILLKTIEIDNQVVKMLRNLTIFTGFWVLTLDEKCDQIRAINSLELAKITS